MTFRVPNFLRANFLRERPVESLLAAALLVGLLFLSADPPRPAPAANAMIAASEKN
jgi:hypothetical protein